MDFKRKTLDPIHGFMEFDDDTWALIDTPEFQRLREIKHLGGAAYVYPAATHTRFEHSLGTAYLVQDLLENLSKYQSGLFDIREESKEQQLRFKRNIIWAGLLHDLGHGPFSHLFDKIVIPELEKGTRWTHEEASVMMLRHLWQNNPQAQKFLDDDDLKIIGEYIAPTTQTNRWMYQIVSNPINSIDVDKFDYLTRDSYHLGLKDTFFDYRTLMKECRVIDDQICYPAKQAYKVNDLFQSRYKLFKVVYNSPSTLAVELMISEALIYANKVFKLTDKIRNPKQYLHLTDHILQDIELKDASQVIEGANDLKKAQEVIRRLRCHDIYKLAGESILGWDKKPILDTILSNMDATKNEVLSYGRDFRKEDFELKIIRNDYGSKNNNPYDSVRFFNKDDTRTSFTLDTNKISLLLPQTFAEFMVRIYVKDSDRKAAVEAAFQQYSKIKLGTESAIISMKKPSPVLKIGSS